MLNLSYLVVSFALSREGSYERIVVIRNWRIAKINSSFKVLLKIVLFLQPQEVLLGVGSNLGTGPCTHMLLNFSPVFSVESYWLKKLEVLLFCPSTVAYPCVLVILLILPALSGWTLGGAEGAVWNTWLIGGLFLSPFESHLNFKALPLWILLARYLIQLFWSFSLFCPKLPWGLVDCELLENPVFLSLNFRLLNLLISLQSCGTFNITSPEFKVLEELLIFWVHLVRPLRLKALFLSWWVLILAWWWWWVLALRRYRHFTWQFKILKK